MAVEQITIEGRANMVEVEEALERTGLKMSQLTTYMRRNFLVFNKNREIIDDFSGDMLKTTQVMKQAGLQTRRFKFEWLSIMFAGMALDRAFGGLLRTQMELFGVTDMLSAAWTTVLLPIMELLTPILYKMLEIFMDMPEWLKLATGGAVLFGAGLGKIFTVVGQIVLAWMGFKLLGIASMLKGFGLAASGGATGLAAFSTKSSLLASTLFGPLGLTAAITALVAIPLWKYIDALGEQSKAYRTMGGALEDTDLASKIIDLTEATGYMEGATRMTTIEVEKLTDSLMDLDKVLISVEGMLVEQPRTFEEIRAEHLPFVFGEKKDWNWLEKKLGWQLPSWIGGTREKMIKAELSADELFKALQDGSINATQNISELGFMIGSSSKGSFPLVFSLSIAKKEWISMGNTAIFQINRIILALERIPRNITTMHTIIQRTIRRILGSRQGGGPIPTTGLYLLHAGEYVIPAGRKETGTGQIIINATYNIGVSDKAELERMMRSNNLRLVEEVKRQITI